MERFKLHDIYFASGVGGHHDYLFDGQIGVPIQVSLISRIASAYNPLRQVPVALGATWRLNTEDVRNQALFSREVAPCPQMMEAPHRGGEARVSDARPKSGHEAVYDVPESICQQKRIRWNCAELIDVGFECSMRKNAAS